MAKQTETTAPTERGVLANRIHHKLRECRGHRSRERMARFNPVAFRAAHGYSYRPLDALRECQRDLVSYRAALVRAERVS